MDAVNSCGNVSSLPCRQCIITVSKMTRAVAPPWSVQRWAHFVWVAALLVSHKTHMVLIVPAAGVTCIMIRAEVRSRAYFALALIPSVYWGFWCAFGVLFFSSAIFGNWAGIPLLALSIIGFSGLIYSLKSLWAAGEMKPKVMLARACIYLCLAFILGSVVWVQFVPSRHGIYFGWWLIIVASFAALDILSQCATARTSRSPSARV